MITFRLATQDDALFIARGFHTAMLMEDVPEERIRTFAENICTRTDVLYSAPNTMIALMDNEPVGMITAYDGRFYRAWRERTFEIVERVMGITFPNMDDEALPGEYYIDSLAVLPANRSNGIGKALLQQAIARAGQLGIPRVTIAVDPDNPRAERLYASLGFQPDGTLFIFGHDYKKMAMSTPN